MAFNYGIAVLFQDLNLQSLDDGLFLPWQPSTIRERVITKALCSAHQRHLDCCTSDLDSWCSLSAIRRFHSFVWQGALDVTDYEFRALHTKSGRSHVERNAHMEVL